MTQTLTGAIVERVSLSGSVLRRTPGAEATGDYKLDPADLALLRSPSQRFRLRIAFTPAYTPTVTNWTRPSGSGRESFDWTPESNLTSNTIGVVGSPVYYYLGNAQNRNGGAIAGSHKTFDWGDGSSVVSPADGLISHSYSAAGTYEVLFAITDPDSGVSFTSHRWVRVFYSLDDADGVADVQGLQGSAGTGWTVSLKVTDTTGDYRTGAFPDRLGVILWLEQTWGVDDARGRGTQKTLGWTGWDNQYDPRIVFVGYLMGNTVRVDSETHEVTFRAQTADAMLQVMRLKEMVFLDSAKAGYGHTRSGLRFADAVNHLLHQHTNWGAWHSFSAWREAWPDVNPIHRATFNAGFLWQALTDCAKNELGRLQGNKDSRVLIAPDANIRGLTWWGVNTVPPEMPFDTRNIIEISVEELQANRIGYVQLTGSDPFGGTVLTAKYPATPGDVGADDTRDIICHDQDNLDAWAERLYYSGNARYKVTLTTAMTKPLEIGQLVVVDYADPQGRYDLTAEVGGGVYRMPFYVESVSYAIDIGLGTWKTTLSLSQIVRMRWKTGAAIWETYNGSAWEGV